MQTFLPYNADFRRTAKVLDNKRLFKQGVEVYQLLRVNAGLTTGWRNHPAAVQWQGYEFQLASYGCFIVEEARARGYKTDLDNKILDVFRDAFEPGATDDMPLWIYNVDLGITHTYQLYLKDPEHYAEWEEYRHLNIDDYVCCPGKCRYYWPSHTSEYGVKK